MADPVGVAVAFDAQWDTVTPTWTRIDTLAGCRVRDWQIDRGRPNEFEKTGTGTAVIRIVDRDGLFDPTNGTSTYDGKILPGKQAAIAMMNPVSDVWWTLFRGYIETWSYRLDQTRQYMEFELQLVDGFAVLSRRELIPGEDGLLSFTGLPDEDVLNEMAAGNVLYGETADTVSTRINAVLNDADWPVGLTDVFSGNVRVGPKAYGPGTSALDALWDAVDGEFPGVGNLFMSKDGFVRFRGRQARFRPDVAEYGIQRRTVGDPSATALDVDVVPVSELEWSLGWDNVYNIASATPERVGSGATSRPLDPRLDDVPGQYVKDTASIDAHGPRSITFENLQTIEGIAWSNNSMVETKLFATYYVENYATPAPRITRMVFKSRRPGNTNGSALWNHLTRCEISDLLTLQTEHPGGGGFDTDFYVEGIHMRGSPGTPDYPAVELSLDVSPAAHYTTNPFDDDPDPPEPFGDAVMTLAATYPANTLLGYWRLGEASSPWADTSGHSGGAADATEAGSGTAVTPNVTGALPTADDDGAVEINEGKYPLASEPSVPRRFNRNSGSIAVSAAAWVKPLATVRAFNACIVGCWRNGAFGNAGWTLQLTQTSSSHNVSFIRRETGSPADAAEAGPETLTVDEWVFVVGTYDGVSDHNLYVNGVLVAQDIDAAVLSLPANNTGVTIGGPDGTLGSGGGVEVLSAQIDEVSVWGVALTLAEIQALYEAGTT